MKKHKIGDLVACRVRYYNIGEEIFHSIGYVSRTYGNLEYEITWLDKSDCKTIINFDNVNSLKTLLKDLLEGREVFNATKNWPTL